jgi:UDP-N-acetylmuramate: L-alanyl-gamma-D-glutamyl-meso-diaminopimelate ligase
LAHLHIVGICGTFMGGIALIARQLGHTVTGCDANVYPPMSTQLEAAGITLTEGFGAEQLDIRPDVFVIGNVAKRGMPLIEAILDAQAPYASGPQWLGEQVLRGQVRRGQLSHGQIPHGQIRREQPLEMPMDRASSASSSKPKWVLAVAGTHGKTTTSSMLAWILEYAGLNPGFLIGGVPENFGVSARITESPYFVIEADEYDTAFFDKRSKFVHYQPKTAVLNNLEFDHADIFADLAAIETQFHHLVRTVPSQGLVVANGTEESLTRTLARGVWTPVERFGTDEGWQAREADGGFDVVHQGAALGQVRWQVMGLHNRMNALAAIAAARHAGVSVETACAALGSFASVKRRMEVKGTVRGVTVYDDFAHHPTAIATTIDGLRRTLRGALSRTFPLDLPRTLPGALPTEARILAVIEPRSNTMKLGTMKAKLPASLEAADVVFGYAGGLGWDLAEALQPLGSRAKVEADIEALANAIAKEARAGDHVLIMSNGGFGGLHGKVLARLGAG